MHTILRILLSGCLVWLTMHPGISQSVLSIPQRPQLVELESNRMVFQWNSTLAGSTGIRYAKGEEESFTELEWPTHTTEHQAALEDLEPAKLYHIQFFVRNDTAEYFTSPGIYTTASTSSGLIEVYFNQGVLASFSDGSTPTGTTPQAVENRLIELINNTQETLDLSVYNTSRPGIVEAVKEAHARGVRVRIIADQEASNSGWKNPAPPFPVVYGNDPDLMHNKFLVMDVDDPDNCYVVTGSMNLTYGNVLTDFNNTLVIQDQSLALAYTIEFEEMWGSSGANPIPSNARFGSQKLDNTPHQFNIGGVPMELYFSPSDGTTSEIYNALLSADEDLQFAVLTLTKDELSGAILNRFQSGVSVRGIIENIDDNGGDYPLLSSQGVNVSDHPPSSMMHHKYGLIDATAPASNPIVVTGSHNWTNRAETGNDENTLFIFDASIANMYLQEFERMWAEIAPTSTYELANTTSALYAYPNPSRGLVWVEIPQSAGPDAEWSLFDLHGRLLQSGIAGAQPWVEISLHELPAGMYSVVLQQGARRWSQRLVRMP